MKKKGLGPLGFFITVVLTLGLIFGLAQSSKNFVITFFSVFFAILSVVLAALSIWRVYKKRNEFIKAKAESLAEQNKTAEDDAEAEKIRNNKTALSVIRIGYAIYGLIFIAFGYWIYSVFGAWTHSKALNIFTSIFFGLSGIGFMIYPGPLVIKKLNRETKLEDQKIYHTIPINEDIKSNLSIIDQCKAYVKQIEAAAAVITDEKINKDLCDISRYVSDIFIYAEKNDAEKAQISKLVKVYLPITIKLCNQYIELSEMKQETSTAKELKSKIAAGIENAKTAFAKLNDNLLQNISFDIEAELKAFQNILTIDGLLGEELMLPKKDSEKEEI